MSPAEELTRDHFLNHPVFFVKVPHPIPQRVLPGMKAGKYARIINFGGKAAEHGNENFSDYAAAKAAMPGLTRSWARGFETFRITANPIGPVLVPVERHADWVEEILRSADARERNYAPAVPSKYQGKPEDVAETAAFPASGEAHFITGQKIAVNGGNTLL